MNASYDTAVAIISTRSPDQKGIETTCGFWFEARKYMLHEEPRSEGD